jgi:hypothetical protein
MSDPGIVMMFGLATTASVLIIRTIGSTIIKLRKSIREEQAIPAPMSDDRMARLEAAVEAIAIEVERISEGQRFTTKLLSDSSRVTAPPKVVPPKFDTPH